MNSWAENFEVKILDSLLARVQCSDHISASTKASLCWQLLVILLRIVANAKLAVHFIHFELLTKLLKLNRAS